MYKFRVYNGTAPASEWSLGNSYLVGADSVAMMSEIKFQDGGEIHIQKRESGTAALFIQHEVGELGELMLQTAQLPEREEPYLLVLELARHRLMMLYVRLEEWSMFDLGDEHAVTARTKKARDLFVEALTLQIEDPPQAQKMAQQCLVNAIDGSEELTLAHSELLLSRRRDTGAVSSHPLGIGACLRQHDQRILGGMQMNFDTVVIPMPWRVVAPKEDTCRFDLIDPWVQWATQAKRRIQAGPLINFTASQVPDWMYIWEHDYDTMRDLAYEHIEKIVSRYRNSVHVWNVCSGLNINDHFSFGQEQLVDLTRTASMLVKKIAPKSKVMLEVRQPFGEYMARNVQGVPPLQFVEMLQQASVNFDQIGLWMPIGQAVSGQYARDLLQISTVIDYFGHQGKSLQVTFGVPSEPVTSMMIDKEQRASSEGDQCGHWRRPWTGQVQGHWLEACMHIAFSRPYVDNCVWLDIVDHPKMSLPMSGLVDEQLRPKKAFKRLVHFRNMLLGLPEPKVAPPATPETPPDPPAPPQA